MATGTVTVAEERLGGLKKITWAWTSTAGGAASEVTTYPYTGSIERMVTVPAAAGGAPTDDYDITITDEDGVDVLSGAGSNRDTANTEQVAAANLGAVANDKLTLNVSNAGNAKSGTVILYVRAR